MSDMGVRETGKDARVDVSPEEKKQVKLSSLGTFYFDVLKYA